MTEVAEYLFARHGVKF